MTVVTRPTRMGPLWKELVFGLALLWVGCSNLASTLRLYASQGALTGLFVLLCESSLLAGSSAAIGLALAPILTRRNGPQREEDLALWSRVNAKRLRQAAMVGLLGLAWCLGSLP
jgi:hypothetical protein